jgi:hypothetical protein
MKRRIAIRNLVLLSAGATMLDACATKEAVTYRNIPLTDSQADMLSELAETIIPTTTDFIGAKDLQSAQFTLMMIDDLGKPEQHTLFLEGMNNFDEACKAKTGSTFTEASKEQRHAFLATLEDGETRDQPEGIQLFYGAVKHFTIESFTTSEAYLTKVKNFSLIPEKFQGCVPVVAA